MGTIQTIDCLLKVESPIREKILEHMLQDEDFNTTNVEVWVYPTYGFVATLKETTNSDGIDKHTLHIQYAIGLNMYKSHGMNMLKRLAKELNCYRLTGVAKTRVVYRLLTRLGFKPICANYMEYVLNG